MKNAKKELCWFVHDMIKVRHCVDVLGLLVQTISNNIAMLLEIVLMRLLFF